MLLKTSPWFLLGCALTMGSLQGQTTQADCIVDQCFRPDVTYQYRFDSHTKPGFVELCQKAPPILKHYLHREVHSYKKRQDYRENAFWPGMDYSNAGRTESTTAGYRKVDEDYVYDATEVVEIDKLTELIASHTFDGTLTQTNSDIDHRFLTVTASPNHSVRWTNITFTSMSQVLATSGQQGRWTGNSIAGCASCGRWMHEDTFGFPTGWISDPAVVTPVDAVVTGIDIFGNQISGCTSTARHSQESPAPVGGSAYTDETLSNEYTDQDLENKVRALMNAQAWGTLRTAGSAMRLWSPSREWLYLRRMLTHFTYATTKDVPYTLSWTELTFTATGSYSVPRSYQFAGTGAVVTYDHIVEPPKENGFTIVIEAKLCRTPPPGPGSVGCAGCAGGSDLALGGPGVSSDGGGVALTMGLGTTGFGYPAGAIVLRAGGPSPDIANARSLSVTSVSADTEVITDPSGALLQIRSAQALAHVEVVSGSQFSVDFLAPPTAPKVGGLYPTAGLASIVKWTVVAPDAGQGSFDRVRVIERRGGIDRVNEFLFEPASGRWTLIFPDALRVERTWTGVSGGTYALYSDPASGQLFTGHDTLTRYREVVDPVTGAVLQHEEVAHMGIGNTSDQNFRTVSKRVGTGANALVTTTTYDTSGSDGWMKTTSSSDGWHYYTYAQHHRMTKHVTGVENGTFEAYDAAGKDDALCHVQVYRYDSVDPVNDPTLPADDPRYPDLAILPDLSRTQTEYLLGVAVSQTKRVIGKDAATGALAWIKEYRMHSVDADQTDAGGLGNAANLLTTTTYHTTTLPATGAIKGLVKSVSNPDGTGSFYSYVDSGGVRTTTTRTGWLNATKTDLVAGTQTVGVVATDGRQLSSTTTDIASNLTTSSTTYGNFDPQGRAQLVTYLGGLTEQFQYACCGLETQINREGTATTHTYDALKRRTSTTTAGVTTINSYGASGNLAAVRRVGSDGSVMPQAGYAYDDAGRMTSQTNALGVVTTYAEDVSQGFLVRTTTEASGTADQVTHVERYYRDGRLAETSGTGDNPTRYEHGLLTDGALQVPYRRTIKLTAPGTTTGVDEWVTTVSDFFGRTYKTFYADATPATLADNPKSRSFYDNQGRLAKTVDPDGVTTLYSRPSYSESVTAVDMDLNGVIDFAGIDRITKTVTDVATAWGQDVRRTTTYDYTLMNNATAVVTAVSEASMDGRRSWQTTVGVANPATTVTAYPGGGYRDVTTTAPDGSSVHSVYLDGRLQSTTRNKADGTQIGRTSYTYDAHGRQWKVTDARNGTTVSTYDAGDQVRVVTTPQPGNGQPARTTTAVFDNLGRAKAVTQPDGTVSYSEYWPTGLLKRAWGSRTYPVEYAYDAQGRVKTLKTYRAFSGNWSNPGTADTTTWNYDAFRGWLDNKRHADGKGPDYSYKPSGRMWKRQWWRGAPRVETVWSYNNAGDLQTLTYNGDGDLTPDVTYGYDRHGCQTTVSSAATGGTWTVTRTFGLQHNLLTEAYSGAHPLAGLTETLSYDSVLRRSTFALSGPAALIQAFSYDGASRLEKVREGSFSASYGYLVDSPLVETVTMRQGPMPRMMTTNSHDYLDRLHEVRTQPRAAGSMAIGSGYRYDAADQRALQLSTDGSFWRYDYDDLGQVITGKHYFDDGTPVPGQQFEYAYDTVGNRTGAKHGGDAAGTNLRGETYLADGLDRYTSRTAMGGRSADILGLAAAGSSVTVNGTAAWRRGEYFRAELGVGGSGPAWQNVDITTSGGGGVTGKKLYVPPMLETYTYDDDGNLTGDGRWTYTWDAENRLVRMETTAAAYGAGVPRQLLQFDHDDQGRRIRKRMSNWNGTAYVPASDVRFALDGWNVVAELDGLGGNALLRSYLWGLDLSGTMDGAGGVGGLIAMKPNGGNAQFAAYDGNGNVIGLVDGATGATSANYEYGPFGETLRLTGTQAAANPFRFSTKATEPESGLVYYGYRYYNPATGRWINRDPSNEHNSDSLYSLVGNHPVCGYDYLGLYEKDFHFYTIFYLARLKCFDKFDAKRLADASQRIDDFDETEPLWTDEYTRTRWHFHGSSSKLATKRAPADLAAYLAGELSSGSLQLAGYALHTFADSWSHEGFSGFSTLLNKRNGLWPFGPGHLDTDEFGTSPDLPFNDVPNSSLKNPSMTMKRV